MTWSKVTFLATNGNESEHAAHGVLFLLGKVPSDTANVRRFRVDRTREIVAMGRRSVLRLGRAFATFGPKAPDAGPLGINIPNGLSVNPVKELAR